MSRFVNPFTDLGFKVIFGQPASKGLLITLLNELLAGEHHIEDLCFLDKETMRTMCMTKASFMTSIVVRTVASISL